MKLKDILNQISVIAENNGLTKPFIVGGLPRDKVLNKFNNFNDVDITTGDNTVFTLAQEINKDLNKYIVEFKTLSDGHSSIIMNGVKIDFSSNFKIPNIENILQKYFKIKNITEMHKELYSRDFTCNALLMTMDFNKIYDLTGYGVKDIRGKIIKTILTPYLTFVYNKNRIIRTGYLSAKLDFDIDPKIIEWIKNNKQYVSDIKPEYLKKKILKGYKYNPKRMIDFLNQTELWTELPPIKGFEKYISRGLI